MQRKKKNAQSRTDWGKRTKPSTIDGNTSIDYYMHIHNIHTYTHIVLMIYVSDGISYEKNNNKQCGRAHRFWGLASAVCDKLLKNSHPFWRARL